jgi:hypothetical protein
MSLGTIKKQKCDQHERKTKMILAKHIKNGIQRSTHNKQNQKDRQKELKKKPGASELSAKKKVNPRVGRSPQLPLSR